MVAPSQVDVSCRVRVARRTADRTQAVLAKLALGPSVGNMVRTHLNMDFLMENSHKMP